MRLYRHLHPADEAPDAGQARVVYDEIMRTPGMRLYVIEDGGGLVATTYLNLVPNLSRGLRPYGVVENVVVDQGRRGTGVGKAVMAGTLRAAWDFGCYKVMLLTGSRRESTHGFYRACGFSGDAKFGFVARPGR
ncbi:GNAT family N-acetyltransferase [Kribbella sandramycini]|nr:GNAT family N-acetyltransferase [Kribbella sandramycini]MBB6569258.1 GNAT superfamily N-acetyltransferase [Kribbella sandramycini]